MTPTRQDDLLDRARKVIQELREKLRAAEEQNRPDPVAIIGVAFRFPGAGCDPEQLWEMIANGRDAVRPIPPDRWDRDAFFAPEAPESGKINTRHGAFLDDVRRFDAGFFDITPREAIRMDPQQRLFLETAWHALEDAGLPLSRVAGSDTAVFVGVHNHSADYQAMQFEMLETLDPYSATGTAHDMIAGRLAYWLDLHGPAMAVNTACSSSLSAVHLACRGVRNGDCSVAIVAGINMMLGPRFTVGAAQLQLLSPEGRCHTFDARANGMGRGEGCGVIVLKRLSAARRDGDRVLALIRGSAMNQDGRTNGLTAPNGLAQKRVLRDALKDAGVSPAEIGYVETHGTGTKLGDPIEVEALAEVLGSPLRTSPCALGAIKANLGHLEGAAGIAGLIKAVMVLRRGWIPPVANLETINPHISTEGSGLEIPRRGRPWTAEAPRRAGVSSFGWSGTNVHVVLEQAPPEQSTIAGMGPWPVLVSARSPEALHELALLMSDRLASADGSELAAISYTSAVRRTHHAYRIGIEGSDPRAIAAELRLRAADGANSATLRDSELGCWEAGAEIPWQERFGDSRGMADLPLYPFQGKSYWLESSPATRQRHAAPAKCASDDWVYQVAMIEKELPSTQVSRKQPARWLVVGRDSGMRVSIARAIRLRGDLPEVYSPFPDAAQLLAELARDGRNPQYILWIVENEEPAVLIGQALESAKAILRSGLPARLWWVTEGSGTEPFAPNTACAALRGFNRVLGLEHPEIAGGLIDTDAASAAAVCEEIAGAVGEDRVGFRTGRRWLPRLRRATVPASAPLRVRDNRSYLITGAFGSIGMEIGEWLIAAGARHLVLVGRRDPARMGQPEILARIEAWRSQGIEIRAESCDVADEVKVQGLLAELDERGTPLAGLIHAAAAMNFRPLEQSTSEDVLGAFRAKYLGARVLDRSTRSCDLDFFILFSSAAATMGLRNGAIYAAANSAMEAVVGERAEQGLPALCVEWGFWDSTREDAQRTLIAQSGFTPMRPAAALQNLASLLAAHWRSGLIADIDWQVFGPALETRGRHALVAEITSGAKSSPHPEDATSASAVLNNLSSLPLEERRGRLLDLVGAEVRQMFGMAAADPLDESRGLFQMGMDSLMSVGLKQRLEAATGLHLSGTLTLTYPNVTALAEYLNARIMENAAPRQGAAAAETSRPVEEDREAISLADLDEAQTHAAIAEELATLQKLGVMEP